MFEEFCAGVVGILYSFCRHAGVVPLAQIDNSLRATIGTCIGRFFEAIVLSADSGKLSEH